MGKQPIKEKVLKIFLKELTSFATEHGEIQPRSTSKDSGAVVKLREVGDGVES